MIALETKRLILRIFKDEDLYNLTVKTSRVEYSNPVIHNIKN